MHLQNGNDGLVVFEDIVVDKATAKFSYVFALH